MTVCDAFFAATGGGGGCTAGAAAAEPLFAFVAGELVRAAIAAEADDSSLPNGLWLWLLTEDGGGEEGPGGSAAVEEEVESDVSSFVLKDPIGSIVGRLLPPPVLTARPAPVLASAAVDGALTPPPLPMYSLMRARTLATLSAGRS